MLRQIERGLTVIASLLSPARRKTMVMTGPLRIQQLIVFAITALAVTTTGARADQFDAARQQKYEDCMAQAQGLPADGYETALAWEGQGGGDPARHCAAVALIGLGKYEEAATQLESLGSDLAPKKPQLAAEAFGQAGQAWTSANQPAKALAVQNAGLKLAPDDVDLLVDRAFTQKSLNEFAKALDDLNKAATLDPKRADVLTYRASTYRFLNRLPEARADADAAVTLDPKNAEALLERGIIRRLADDPAGARADWLQVVEMAGGTPAADAAKANLEKLDVKP
jgi:tetratricopeptide (TPR) repeat protein